MFWTFIVLGIVMWLLQGLLNIYQLKKFNKELKNLRQSGRVAIGKARGRFKAGCLLLLCIDDDCKIITGKKLQGVTSFARFKDFNELNGTIVGGTDQSFDGFGRVVDILIKQ